MVGPTKRSAKSPKEDQNVSPVDKRLRRSVNKEEIPDAQIPKRAVGRPIGSKKASLESPIKSTRSTRGCKEQNSSTQVPEATTPTKSGITRSKHLLVSPVPIAQPHTPTRSKMKIDIQTPTRRSRRLSTDATEVSVASLGPPIGIETPTKRSKRLSSNLGETDSIQVLTPTRRSRRLSTGSESNNAPESLPPKLELLPRRTRRLSTEIIDSPIPQGLRTPTRRSRRLSTDLEDTVTDVKTLLTPTRRSRRLSTDLEDTVTDVKTVLTPTRRSRRLSSGEQDVLNEEIPKVLQNKALKSLSSIDCCSNKTSSSARRSRRLSGSGLIEKPLDVLEEEVEKEGDKGNETLQVSKLKDDGLEIIVEDEKEEDKEKETLPISKPEGDGLEIIVEDEMEEEKETLPISKPYDDCLEVIVEDEKEDENLLASNEKKDGLEVIVEDDNEQETLPTSKLKNDDLELIVEDENEKENLLASSQKNEGLEVVAEDNQEQKTSTTSEPKNDILDITLDDKENEPELAFVKTITEKEFDVIAESKLDDGDEIIVEDACPKLQLEDEAKFSDDDITFIEEVGEGKRCSSTERSPISSSQKKRKVCSPVKVTAANVSSPGSITATAPLATESDVPSTVVNSASATSENSSSDVQSKAATNTLNGEPKATLSPAVKDSEKKDSSSSGCAEDKGNKEVISNSIPKESNNNSLQTKAPDVRGMPASGRWWKDERKRFNSIYKDEGPRSSWSDKMKRKQQLKDFLSLKNEIVEEKKMKKAQLRERQRLNNVRREENARKSEVVQVIKDSRKIKKMKRKQLRYIETRDTSLLK